MDVFYLQRFDDTYSFNDGDEKSRPVLWNEEQLHLPARLMRGGYSVSPVVDRMFQNPAQHHC